LNDEEEYDQEEDTTVKKPDKLFDMVVLKMITALAVSSALLFGGGAIFVYAAARWIPIEPNYDSIVGAFFGVHLSILMVYYAFALFKYIVSD